MFRDEFINILNNEAEDKLQTCSRCYKSRYQLTSIYFVAVEICVSSLLFLHHSAKSL